MNLPILKLVYDPDVNLIGRPDDFIFYSEIQTNLEIGRCSVNPRINKLYWNYHSFEGPNEFEGFVRMVTEFLTEKGYAIACWENSVDFRQVKQELENRFYRYLFKELPDIPLVSSESFKEMVDTWLYFIPSSFSLPWVDTDLSDVINEVGLDTIDIYSMFNMLSHFHGMSWTEKCEMMTVLAYKHNLEIHPLAIAMTPLVAAHLLIGKVSDSL